MRETRSRTNSGPRRFMGGAAISANRTAPSLRTVSVSKTMERSSAATRRVEAACATTELSVSGMVMVWPLLGDEKRKRPNVSATAAVTRSAVSGFMVSLQLRCVTGEDKVAIFGGLVAGKAGFVHSLIFRFAVGELSEPPANLSTSDPALGPPRNQQHRI